MVSYIDVAQATRGSDADYLRQLATASRKEPGVVRYEVFQRTAPSSQFVIIEAWKDQQSCDAHAASAHVKTFRQQIEPHLVAPIDERPYVALAVGAKESAAIPAGSFVSISHVDVIPPKKDDGVAALKALADPTRKDKGNLRYDVYRRGPAEPHGGGVVNRRPPTSAKSPPTNGSAVLEPRPARSHQRWYRPAL
jgi:quinol monooxygenase YgiN